MEERNDSTTIQDKCCSNKCCSMISSLRTIHFVLGGVFFGLVFLLIYISNALSYLSDEPKACINCHIMMPEYATWFHSSHREWATCNDCHIPHENPIRKLAFKASDGLRHSVVFTLRAEPQVIQLNEAGKVVIQNNCLRCHINQVNPVSIANVTGKNYKEGQGLLCWDCHRETPHGRVHSLSSTANAIIYDYRLNTPNWIKSIIK